METIVYHGTYNSKGGRPEQKTPKARPKARRKELKRKDLARKPHEEEEKGI